MQAVTAWQCTFAGFPVGDHVMCRKSKFAEITGKKKTNIYGYKILE